MRGTAGRGEVPPWRSGPDPPPDPVDELPPAPPPGPPGPLSRRQKGLQHAPLIVGQVMAPGHGSGRHEASGIYMSSWSLTRIPEALLRHMANLCTDTSM